MNHEPGELALMKDDISAMRLQIFNLERRLAKIEQQQKPVPLPDLTPHRREKPPNILRLIRF